MRNTRNLIAALGGHELYPTYVRLSDGTFEKRLSRKPGSLVHQVKNALCERLQLGRSKRNDKHHNHGKPSRPILYSTGTMKRYMRACVRFARWIDPNKGIRYYKEARKFVPAYLRFLKRKGCSPRYIKTEACALGKLYCCSFNDFGVRLPSIKRADRDFSLQNQQVTSFYLANPDLCMTILSVGLRHNKELRKVKSSDYRFSDCTGHIVGKNGRPRRFCTLPGLEHLFNAHIQDALDHGRIKPFCAVPDDAPIHHLRRIYACMMYRFLARPIGDIPREQRYYCRAELVDLHLDRVALWQVSRYMGHNRENVTVGYIAPFVVRNDNGQPEISNPLDLMPGAEAYFRDAREIPLRLSEWEARYNARNKTKKKSA